MESLYDDSKVTKFTTDLEFRVYTSRLLGGDDSLVLHGGGNTSVKSRVDGEDILYVKGSGWDLATIQAEGFAPVKLEVLKQMAKLEVLSDSDMVKGQKEAMIELDAPNPSVEAILHAIIPFKYVDHTHADAIVTISNSKGGEARLKDIFPKFLIVPYVMPGFILARTIYEMSLELDWESCEGIILLNHGIFTFGDDAKTSYEKMISSVSLAEKFLTPHLNIERFKKLISDEKGYEVYVQINQSPTAILYSKHKNLKTFATRGVLTPEHILRTKRVPMILEGYDIQDAIDEYKKEYMLYFNKFATDEICLDPSPNWVVVKDFGTISFGKDKKEAMIIEDINNHTMKAVLKADELGGFESISLKDSFEMEYWELEQAKLKS